jgi:MFS family permease
MKMALKAETDRRLIYYLSIIGFFAIFSTTICKNPVLPLFANSLGATPELIGLIAALSPFAGMLFGFPVGILSDRLGRKRLLVASGVIFVTAPLLYILINNPVYLIPLRFFHGLATAILGPIASTMISEAYVKDRGEKLGIYSSATLVGRTLAPLLGGAIISVFVSMGNLWNYRLVYVFASAISLTAFILIIMLHDDPAGKKTGLKVSELLQSAKEVLKHRVIVATALVEMTIYFAFGAFETYLPLYLTTLQFAAYTIGIIFSLQTVSIALTKPVFGRIADRIDKRMQILFGLLLVGFSIAAIPLFSQAYLLIAISLIFGLGMSFATVATSAYTADVADKRRLGASLGALSSIMDIGHTSGPLVVGIIVGAFSYRAGFMSCLALAFATGTFFVLTSCSKGGRECAPGR